MTTGNRIFITGGADFIASHLVERLLDQHNITIYDNLHRNALQFTSFVNHPRLKFIQGDVLDLNALTQAMAGASVCVHAAAIAGIYSVGKSASLTMKVNFLGAYNELETADQRALGPFVPHLKEFPQTGNHGFDLCLRHLGIDRQGNDLARNCFGNREAGPFWHVMTERRLQTQGKRIVNSVAYTFALKKVGQRIATRRANRILIVDMPDVGSAVWRFQLQASQGVVIAMRNANTRLGPGFQVSQFDLEHRSL
jgi:NAD(P)-dependent dehydrogenase (short-subunit alcohol dehydrogenase family)